MNIKERIAAFVAAADQILIDHFIRSGYTLLPAKHEAEYISEKWCRVMSVEPNGRSVYAFICLQDGATKTLGVLKAGDIHKAASWKAPAKHARGNVFQEDFGKCLTPYGVVYIKDRLGASS